MSANERKGYIKAVKCLMSAPSKSDPVLVPGARTRYDDFVAQHMNQTLTIHVTGNFLSWHRYFIYGYEKALREECGYKGYQPYWNWFTYQDNLRASPIFDGSDTSMGGDGSFVKHNGSVGGHPDVHLPSGKGGGCIKSGPFKGVQANLGPLSPAMDGEVIVNTTFAYNPRCLKRDLTTFASSKWFTTENLYNVTLGPASKNIATFQNELQGRFDQGFLGMHIAGHLAIGGDAGDFFSSPNDPAFFLHHGMIDRLWWIWQALHRNQASTIAGTITLFNEPPSRDAVLEDIVQTNYLNLKPLEIKELMSTMDGSPLCYIYL
jgi:tyrosinase